MKYLKVLLYGIYAGLAIGLGSFVFTIVSAYMGDTTAGKIFASALFSVGLILVCVLGLQLYTGKIGVVFDDREKLKENAINLPIMLVGNAIGAFALGILCHFSYIAECPAYCSYRQCRGYISETVVRHKDNIACYCSK